MRYARNLGPWVAVAALSAVWAQEPGPARKIFLPKNPVAAAYMLRRVPNEELVQLERSQPVFVALLQRPGLDQKYRREALVGLAELNQSSEAAELLAALQRLDAGKEEDLPVVSDLAVLLSTTKATQLQSVREQLANLAAAGHFPATRKAGYVGVITADQSVEQAWAAAAGGEATGLEDLLSATAWVRDPQLRESLAPKVEPLAASATNLQIRRAALLALPTIPGHEADYFALLARLFPTAEIREAVVAALQKIPRSRWPKEQVKPLAEAILQYVSQTPADRRTEDAFLSAIQLGNDLAGALPADEGRAIRSALAELGVRVVALRTIPHQMLYDRKELYAQAGKPIQIVLENTDVQPHNLIVTAPGKMEEVGIAAERMQTEPDALERSYIPNLPSVLQSIGLLAASEKGKVYFVAPTEPGDYPYLCTYPGHWRRMNGVLHVVENLDQIPPEELNPETPQYEARPFVQEWTVADLQEDVAALQGGRSLDNAKQLFQAAACSSCHKIQGMGGTIGPELTDVAKTKKYTPADLLREIIEPSHRIDEKFLPQVIQTVDGRVITGIVVREDDQALYLVSNPLVECEPAVVGKDDIDAQFPGKVSIMPTGLLNTLNKDEILDLISYIAAGGDADHPLFQ